MTEESATPESSESFSSTLFEAVRALEDQMTLNMSCSDFYAHFSEIPRAESGTILKLTRRRGLGSIPHDFLILEAMSPDGTPLWIRLEQRPSSNHLRFRFAMLSVMIPDDLVSTFWPRSDIFAHFHELTIHLGYFCDLPGTLDRTRALKSRGNRVIPQSSYIA